MAAKERSYYPEVFLISAAGLLLEINYTRIFSYKVYYFFTYFIIGLALLGFGSAGVFVAVIPRLRRVALDTLIYVCCMAASLSVLVGYIVVSRTPINTLKVFSTFTQPVLLSVISFSVFVTFLLIGLIISAVFAQRPGKINRIYFADLLGAGAACGVAVPLMMLITPPGSIFLAGLLLAVAGMLPAARHSRARLVGAVAVALILAAGVIRPGLGIDVLPDETKGLEPQAAKDAPVHGWGPVFRVHANPVPKAYLLEGRGRINLYHDAMMGSVIMKVDRPISEYTEYKTDVRGIPFQLAPPDSKVLIIGAAGGHEILVGLSLGAQDITAVELNPITYSLLTETYAEYSGNLVQQPGVNYVLGEGRSFIAGADERYDLIYFVAPDSYAAMNAASAGAFVLSESYLYTVEAIMDSLLHLTDDGMICMQFGEFNYEGRPNRTARYVATAREAFRRLGVTDFERHVVVTTSEEWIPISSILLRRRPFPASQIEAIAQLAEQSEKTVIRHAWGRPGDDGPIKTIIESPSESLDTWFREHEVDWSPVTDDGPFFWHFTRFRDVSLFGKISNEIDTELLIGERILLLLLAISVTFGSVFLLTPFIAIRATWRKLPYKFHSLVYFSSLGLGFMFYEVTAIQKLTLFLGFPTYSLTVTLMSILIFAGIGSMLSGRFTERRLPALTAALTLLFGMTLFLQSPVSWLIEQWIAYPLAFRIAMSILFVAPMALCLGAFLPLGLAAFSSTTEHKGEYIAWCWAINGFFSLTGSVLATILSMSFGFRAVMSIAFMLYIFAFIAILPVGQPAAGKAQASPQA